MAASSENSMISFPKIHLEGNTSAMIAPLRKRKPDSVSYVARETMHAIGLMPRLISLNVTRYDWILRKSLEKTDLNTCESRLLLTSKKVAPTPLLNMFTDKERASVREKTGLKVRAFDHLGREYDMIFKFLQCNSAYRVIGEWSRFLRENDGKMRVGDDIEIWAFRIPKGGDSEIGMALLHYEKDEKSLKMERAGEKVERAERRLNVKRQKMEVSPAELMAAEALLQLKGVL